MVPQLIIISMISFLAVYTNQRQASSLILSHTLSLFLSSSHSFVHSLALALALALALTLALALALALSCLGLSHQLCDLLKEQ